MSINATTLSGAITSTQTQFAVASATGITAPNFQTGAGITYLACEEELMLVMGITGTLVTVNRGVQGTAAVAHAASAPIKAGGPSDFANYTPAVQGFVIHQPNAFQGWSAPLAGAATNIAPGPYFHLTGTVAMVTLTPPAGFVEGPITIVFDGSAAGLTWTAAGNIAVAGTATTAASAVTFVFDQGSGKWHPSRLA